MKRKYIVTIPIVSLMVWILILNKYAGAGTKKSTMV